MAQVLVNGGLVSLGLGKQQQQHLFHSHNDHSRCSPSSRSRGVISAAAINGQKQQAFGGEKYYYTLGVKPGSSKQDIKSAYRRLALKYHPDVCKGDHCMPKFKQISTAYEELQSAINSPSSSSQVEQYDYLSEEEDEESEFQGGWEGAWFF